MKANHAQAYDALARYYDAFTKNMDYEKRVEYLCTLLSRSGMPPNGLVLDLACGSGVYSFALLERGYDVVGVDASIEMLGVALEKAEQRQIAPPLLLCQRLEELDLYGTAQGAICLTDSINHLTEGAQLLKFFKRLALFLEPGAPFIFDCNTPYKHEKILADNTFIYENETDDVFCAWRNTWLPQARCTEIQLDIFARISADSGDAYARSSECFRERAWQLRELEAALRKADFTLEHCYGELTQDLPAPNAERVFMVARRN
ncbi:MAG: class I SAM-dependent methyltransferase [Oscillospiraceae bacterium]|jgi:ubiquinone/menaquinone biosynthesis C-methylase UbiE|nr:class I SAM-dependent methyltransferase [Oscillospiraceae bacterium]